LDRQTVQKLIDNMLMKKEAPTIVNGLVQAAQTLGQNDAFLPLYNIFMEVKKSLAPGIKVSPRAEIQKIMLGSSFTPQYFVQNY
jgi:hypothetical protein